MRRKKVKTESESNPMVDDAQPRSTPSDGMDVDASVACPKCERIFSGQQVLDAENDLVPVGVSSWDAECPECGTLVRYRSPTDRVGSRMSNNAETSSPPGAHGGAAVQAAPGDARARDASTRGGDGGQAPTDKPDEVTVCWGDEKFFPDPNDRYSSVVAGAVFVKTSVRPGETHDHAALRAWTVAKRIGIRAREEKVAEFVAKLREVRDTYAER